MLNCTICQRPRRRLLCPTCCHSTLYQSRLTHVETLLAREAAHSQLLSCGASPPTLRIEDNTESLRERAGRVASQVAAYRDVVELLRADLESRKKALQARKGGFLRSREDVREKCRAEVGRFKAKLERVRGRIGVARKLLVREAGGLASVHVRGIFGGRIPKLREVGGEKDASHEDLTATLANVARFLVLISGRYLCVRLPARIMLPYRGEGTRVVVPGREGATRPLFLDTSMGELVQSNRAETVKDFLEGLVWLAADVEFLRKSQAGSAGEMDDLGENLVQVVNTSELGVWSHASVFKNLGSVEGVQRCGRLDDLAKKVKETHEKLWADVMGFILGQEWDFVDHHNDNQETIKSSDG